VKDVRVIGVGNAACGDDGAGLAVAAALADRALPKVAILRSDGDGAELMQMWAGAARAYVVDAVRGAGPPGRVHRLAAGSPGLSARLGPGSSHQFGLAEAVELARALGSLPAELIVFGIEGRRFAPGTGLSPEVAAAVPRVAWRVLAEIRAAQPVRRPRRGGGRPS